MLLNIYYTTIHLISQEEYLLDAVTKYLRKLREERPLDFAKAIMEMSDTEAAAIINDYTIFARESQLPPEGDWRYWVVLAGRGFGKTYTLSNWIIDRVKKMGGVHVVVGQHTRDLRTVIMDVGPSSIMKQCPSDFKPVEVNWTYNKLVFPNGGVILGIGGDNADSARGLSSNSVALDEPGKYSDLRETFTQLDLGLRGNDAKMIITGTPVPHEVIKNWHKKAVDEKDPLYRLTTGSTYENSSNLDSRYIRALKEAYGETSQTAKQEIFGQIIWSSPDALFTMENLEKNRVKEEDLPPLVSRIVSIDPAVTASKTSDSTAIVVCGLDADGHGYVLHSTKMKCSPNQWAQRAIALYDEYDCDYVCVEVNNGGDLIRNSLEQIRRNIPIKEVRATVGKITRMEPIALLAERNKVHIVGSQPDLEAQLVEYDGSGRSPDLFDAMGWGLIQLMLGKTHRVTSQQFLL
jgi:phage terminase large subunit-like protein